MAINNESAKLQLDKKILERSKSVMIKNLGFSPDSNKSTSSSDELDETRILIRGSESRKQSEKKIPIFNLQTLDSVVVHKKKSMKEASERVSEFRKTILEEESDRWRRSVGKVTWEESLELKDYNDKSESTTAVEEVGFENIQWKWEIVDELPLNEEINGYTTATTEKMCFDEEMCGYPPTEFCDHDWLIEPSFDGVSSLPV